MRITEQLLKKLLPILKRGAEEEYFETVKIFSDLITQKEENKTFFKSPTKYLKRKGLLSIDKMKMPDGSVVGFYDDKAIAKTLKEYRKRYQEGKGISTPHLIIYKEVVIYERRIFVNKDWKEILCTDVDVDIKKADFGPLMSPMSKEKLRAHIKEVT